MTKNFFTHTEVGVGGDLISSWADEAAGVIWVTWACLGMGAAMVVVGATLTDGLWADSGGVGVGVGWWAAAVIEL